MAARTDNVSDPALAAELLLARRGQAFWARTLNDLPDAGFDAPSLIPGRSRREVIAHVGFHARALARLVEGARSGVELPMYDTAQTRDEEIAIGATLPTEALRHLTSHAAVHLNVEWRDLSADRWEMPVRRAGGQTIPVSGTVRMRSAEVWLHAIDLATGAGFHDLPDEVGALVGQARDGESRRTDFLCPDLEESWSDHSD